MSANRAVTLLGSTGGWAACGTCLGAHGLRENMLVHRALSSTCEELTDWTARTDMEEVGTACEQQMQKLGCFTALLRGPR